MQKQRGTALHAAVRHGKEEAFDLLLDARDEEGGHRVDLNAQADKVRR